MPATILHIEDHEELLRLYRTLLGVNDYNVLSASNGCLGVQLFRKRRPDLVLLDYHMPGLNGETVARLLRKIDAAVPIVILSGEPVPDSVARMVDAVVTKGESTQSLLSLVEQLLAQASKASWRSAGIHRLAS